KFGTKTEVKNVASFSGVHKAISFEIQRQMEVLEDGGAIVQETRGWDADRNITVSQRGKESAHDYRYFPEPDLVPVVVDEAWEERIRQRLPELPRSRKQRFEREYALSAYDAGVLTGSRAMADYYEATLAAGAPAKPAANWVMGDLQALLSDSKKDIADCPITPVHLATMVGLIQDNTISGKIGKELLVEMYKTGAPPQQIIEQQGWVQVSDRGELEAVVREVLEQNPGPVADFRAGKQKAMGFLVGQMMKATKGKGNPKMINELLQEQLKE
ncbi:MAG: Asp-tRNA(Asn)/Glu-tRNA(Gln) amidotransferase GatCAB subunit B, partial [Candidatus Hydrogenedentales bacterium]